MKYTNDKKQTLISVSPKVYVSLHDKNNYVPIANKKIICNPILLRRHNE